MSSSRSSPPYLGPHTARTALRTFALRPVQMQPEKLTLDDALKVVASLKPTLAGLLGSAKADEISRMLNEELER